MNDSLSPFPSFTLCHDAINYQFVTSESSAMNVFLVPSSSNPSHAAGWIKVYPDDGQIERRDVRFPIHFSSAADSMSIHLSIHPPLVHVQQRNGLIKTGVFIHSLHGRSVGAGLVLTPSSSSLTSNLHMVRWLVRSLAGCHPPPC